MIKIFLTGGAGFIGRCLVKMLADKGHKVTALDNYRFSNQHQLFNHENVEWISGDTRDWDLVSSHVKGKDAVIHLAAPSSFLMHEENELEACNFTLIGFKTVMEAMRKYGIPKIVWASTSAVYERNDVPYYEGMVLNPPDSKAGCKLFCEQEARRYSERYGITCVGMRPFSVYGIGEHTKGGYANVVSLFSWAMLNNERPIVWGDGSQTRDYIFVEDTARAFVMALEKDIPTQELNVGYGKEHTFNEVIQIINEELGTDLQPKYVPVPIKIYAHRLWADMTLVEKNLEFTPAISLREGIQRVLSFSKELKEKESLTNMQLYYKKLSQLEYANV